MIYYCCAALDASTGEVLHLHSSSAPLHRDFVIRERDKDGVERAIELQFFTVDSVGDRRLHADTMRPNLEKQVDSMGWKASAPVDLKDSDIKKEVRRAPSG